MNRFKAATLGKVIDTHIGFSRSRIEAVEQLLICLEFVADPNKDGLSGEPPSRSIVFAFYLFYFFFV